MKLVLQALLSLGLNSHFAHLVFFEEERDSPIHHLPIQAVSLLSLVWPQLELALQAPIYTLGEDMAITVFHRLLMAVQILAICVWVVIMQYIQSRRLSPVEKNNSYRSIKIETSKQSFDERLHTVTIDNFTATLINNPYDKVNEFSALQIAVLQSSGSRQDSINRNSDNAYRAHVMVESRVMLNNGRLSIDGVLQDAKIETKDSAGVQITHITMPRISIKIDEQMSPDDIAVVIGSDVGNLESGISTRYLPGKASLVYDVSSASTSNEVLEFSGYPNPVTQGAATIDAQVAQTQQVTIGLYDQDNTLILPIYSGALQGHSRRSFPVNLQQLAPGIYYLRLTRSASSLSRRVVIR